MTEPGRRSDNQGEMSNAKSLFHNRTALMSAAFYLLACLLAGAGASAQSWPTHPVNVVVPFTAGTTSDVVARALVDDLARNLGQPFVIDNRGGAGGNIGAGLVAKAKPDGYTLLLATTGPAATNKLMYKDLPFDSQRDFAPDRPHRKIARHHCCAARPAVKIAQGADRLCQGQS